MGLRRVVSVRGAQIGDHVGASLPGVLVRVLLLDVRGESAGRKRVSRVSFKYLRGGETSFKCAKKNVLSHWLGGWHILRCFFRCVLHDVV